MLTKLLVYHYQFSSRQQSKPTENHKNQSSWVKKGKQKELCDAVYSSN